MEWLQHWLDQSQFPILSAFLLGLMMAISPCPLATNITAIAYISRDIGNRRRIFLLGLLYTLGRAVSYTALGVIIYYGASAFKVSLFFQKHFDKIIGPLLLLTGILMLAAFNMGGKGTGKWMERIEERLSADKGWGSLLLGILFALAFCPYSGVLYFGMLVPMTLAENNGLVLPAVFAIATGLPVILAAYFLAFTLAGIGKFYDRMKTFESVFRKVVAAVFILAGLYFTYIAYIK
jgi:cytochrome c biogenesis protein CcdA